MSQTFRRIVLASRPSGWVTPENFRLETAPVPQPGPDEVLVRVHYMSLDPYMRGRMNDAKSYAQPQVVGQTMQGGSVGEVMQSNNARFKVGDKVIGPLGWTEYAVSTGAGLSVLDASHIPLSAFLGPVGMPGMTAWYGFYKIMEAKAGQTVVVSAASGAVGSVVGQLAKMNGVRVVGIAGGPDKCRYVKEELGFDACVDYKKAANIQEMAALLKPEVPDGIDAHFENVGGDVLNAVLSLLNPFARVAICGLISDYNNAPGTTPKSAILNPSMFLVARFKMQGFIVSDHLDLWPQGLKELGGYVASGQLKYRESVAQGIEAAPAAFIGMLKGENFGKQLVKLS